jgi:hypothetical protein
LTLDLLKSQSHKKLLKIGQYASAIKNFLSFFAYCDFAKLRFRFRTKPVLGKYFFKLRRRNTKFTKRFCDTERIVMSAKKLVRIISLSS